MRRIVLAMICLLLSAAKGAEAQPGPGGGGPPAVGVTKAEMRPVTESAEFTGRIEAVHRVEIRARITGFIQERAFREGQEVQAGSVLFRIERAPFEAALEQARADVAAAQAQLENARVALQRARDLRQTGAGTQVALDNAQAQERTANAQMLRAQAAVRIADINLGYTDIISPIDGKIGRASLTPGNVVSPSLTEPLATVVSQDPMRVVFPVSTRAAGELRTRYESRGGAAAVLVRVRLPSGQLYPHTGRIDFVDTQVDRNTDSILVRALVPNPRREGVPVGQPGDRDLIDGQFVTVSVEGTEPVQAVVLPRASVLQDQGGNYVLGVDGEGRAQRRPVQLGRTMGADVVVEEGLKAGETVIVDGLQRVRPGQPVSPAPAAGGPAPAAPPGAAAGSGRQG